MAKEIQAERDIEDPGWSGTRDQCRRALLACAFTEDRVKGGRSPRYPPLSDRWEQADAVLALEEGDARLAEVMRALIVERDTAHSCVLADQYWLELEANSHGEPPVIRDLLLGGILNGHAPRDACPHRR